MDAIRAKKSLGQHFLRSATALAEIIDAARVSPADLVLEVGPGEGVLTGALLASGARVIAVETDERCITLLRERFSEAIAGAQLILLSGDIRNEATQQALFEHTMLGKNPYKIIANIPYYITGFLFRLFLEQLRQPTLIVFLVQKEVAEQIVARDAKESLLSLSVKAYGTPRYVATIDREAFTPPPKVDSAIILIENISRDRLGTLPDAEYFRILHAGLGSKRKMLFGNLVHTLQLNKEDLHTIFLNCGIDSKCRGEDLPFEQWIALATALGKT